MRSTGIKGGVFVVTLAFLHDLVRGDTEVTCVLMESCILPCQFQAGNDEVIHWIHMTKGNTVHSYYHDEDQFKHQDQRFRNRTSLFKEQISRGNASLRLTQVEMGDQGKYKCHTSILEREAATSFINVKVEDAAPVTATSVLQPNFPTQRSVDKTQDGSDYEYNENTKIGVISGIVVLGIIGGLTGFCLYRRNICCSSESPQNQPAVEPGMPMGGRSHGEGRPNEDEAAPLNTEH